MSPRRSTHRSVKVIASTTGAEVSVRPLAVILFDLEPGATYKGVLHWEPFGERLCLSYFRSGQPLLQELPSRGKLKALMDSFGVTRETPSGSVWLDVAKEFLGAYRRTQSDTFGKSVRSCQGQPVLNGPPIS